MKRSLFYLLFILCASTFFSCEDDKKDEPKVGEEWKQVAGDYSGSKLELELNKETLTGYTIKVEAVSEEKVTVSLPYLLPGVKELKMEATLYKATVQEKDPDTYFFNGEMKLTDDSRTVSIVGLTQSGVLKMSVSVVVDSQITGNWKPAPAGPGPEMSAQKYDVKDGNFFLYLASPDDKIDFMGQTMTDFDFYSAVDRAAEAYLASTLKEIVFQPHGVVTFIYSKDGKEVVLSDLAGFYEKDKMIYLTLNVSRLINILRETKAEVIPEGIEELTDLARNGIPLAYEPDGNSKCTLLINKDMALKMLPALTGALTVFQGLMADKPEAAALLAEIKKLAAILPSLDRFELGVNLEKIQ